MSSDLFYINSYDSKYFLLLDEFPPSLNVFFSGPGPGCCFSSHSQPLWDGIYWPRGTEMDALCPNMDPWSRRQGCPYYLFVIHRVFITLFYLFGHTCQWFFTGLTTQYSRFHTYNMVSVAKAELLGILYGYQWSTHMQKCADCFSRGIQLGQYVILGLLMSMGYILYVFLEISQKILICCLLIIKSTFCSLLF